MQSEVGSRRRRGGGPMHPPTRGRSARRKIHRAGAVLALVALASGRRARAAGAPSPARTLRAWRLVRKLEARIERGERRRDDKDLRVISGRRRPSGPGPSRPVRCSETTRRPPGRISLPRTGHSGRPAAVTEQVFTLVLEPST